MGDNESDLHRLSEDVVDHITFIHQTCKKLESPERQLGVQFRKALDTFIKYACFIRFIWNLYSHWCHYSRSILASIEVFIGGCTERNAFRVMNSSTADGAKFQEYRNKLARIMQYLEVISPPNLHVPRLSHHLFSSACPITVTVYRGDKMRSWLDQGCGPYTTKQRPQLGPPTTCRRR